MLPDRIKSGQTSVNEVNHSRVVLKVKRECSEMGFLINTVISVGFVSFFFKCFCYFIVVFSFGGGDDIQYAETGFIFFCFHLLLCADFPFPISSCAKNKISSVFMVNLCFRAIELN